MRTHTHTQERTTRSASVLLTVGGVALVAGPLVKVVVDSIAAALAVHDGATVSTAVALSSAATAATVALVALGWRAVRGDCVSALIAALAGGTVTLASGAVAGPYLPVARLLSLVACALAGGLFLARRVRPRLGPVSAPLTRTALGVAGLVVVLGLSLMTFRQLSPVVPVVAGSVTLVGCLGVAGVLMARRLGARSPRLGARVSTGLLGLVLAGCGGAGSAVAPRLSGGGGGAADELVSILPSETDFYVTAVLNPSLEQKVELAGHGLSGFDSASAVDKHLDDALALSLGEYSLTYSGDIKPWIGSQLGLAGIPQTGEAILFSAADPALAEKNLSSALARSAGTDTTIHTENHAGAVIHGSWVTGSDGDELVQGYVIVHGVAALSRSDKVLQALAEAAGGTRATLGADPTFRDVADRLPADRLSLIYQGEEPSTRRQSGFFGSGWAGLLSNAVESGAIRAMAASVSAQSSAFRVDAVVATDPSHMSQKTAAYLAHVPNADGPNSAMAWVPTTALGVLGFHGDSAALAGAVLNSIAPDLPADLGLSGPQRVLSHATGDSALVVDNDASRVDIGVVIAIDDQRSVNDLMSQSVDELTYMHGQYWTSMSYAGTSISYDAEADYQYTKGINAYAVTPHALVMGTTLGEVQAMLDAHSTGSHAFAGAAGSGIAVDVNLSEVATTLRRHQGYGHLEPTAASLLDLVTAVHIAMTYDNGYLVGQGVINAG